MGKITQYRNRQAIGGGVVGAIVGGLGLRASFGWEIGDGLLGVGAPAYDEILFAESGKGNVLRG